MKLIRFLQVFCRQNKSSNNNRLIIQFTVALLVSCFLLSDVTASPQPDKYYLRIAHNASSDKNDLDITSIGVLSLKNNMVGYVDLTHLDSDMNGKALTLDFGAGLAFNWHVSPYISIGVSLGYNSDKDESIAAYFPEVGIVMDITQRFGITFSGKRYYSLYEEDVDIIMLGLVFRN